MPTASLPVARSLTPIGAAVCSLLLALGSAPASATSFNVTGSNTSAQTLGSGSGQTGSIGAAGSLVVGGSSAAVTVTGDNATLTNLGTLKQTGTGRAVRDNTGVKNLVVNNGDASHTTALMQTADADVIQLNVGKGSVTLNNYGTMNSLNASQGGSQAVDFNAITTGANTVNNYATGVLSATEADAVRPGVNGVVHNDGTIKSVTTTGSSSDGIDAQNNTGIQVFNEATGLVQGGRHGITGGPADAATAFTIGISNAAGGTIRGDNGAGINIDGFNAREVVTINNGGTIVGKGVTADGDGVDVDGLVNLTNTGVIRSINAYNAPASGVAYSEGVTVGGGTIVNAGTIEGLVAAGNTNAVGRGITLSGNDITSGQLAGTREGLYGSATITNQAGGTIRGQGDSAIVAEGAASGFTVTIDNNAGGLLVGGGTVTAAVRTGNDRTVIVNAGTIDGGSSGKAIALGGAGNNGITIAGGSARVIGSIDGGSGAGNTLVVDPGTGNAFAYAGAILNVASAEFRSGTTTLSGRSGYTGQTIVSGGALVLDGADRIAAASALLLAGGMLDASGVGANGQTFASLALSGDAAIDFGASSLTFGGLGTIASGTTLALVDVSNTSGYVMRFLGNLVDDAAFQSLMRVTTINDRAAAYRFDGAYTDVLVNAVPEPASAALVLGGLGLMGALRRRRKAARD
jgi:hypothetical protein